jgi:hypothetical protein
MTINLYRGDISWFMALEYTVLDLHISAVVPFEIVASVVRAIMEEATRTAPVLFVERK